MSQISQKSISGITSITTPAGIDDQLTLHTSDTSQAAKLDSAGNFHFSNHVNTTGITSASNFKTGSSNLHSTGLTVGDTFVHSTGVNASSMDIDDFVDVGNNIKLGNAGVITATSFVGDGSDLTNLPAGLGTALSATATSPLNKMYYTNQVLGVPSSITIDVPASASKAYTQYADIKVESSADLIIAEGDDLIPDVLGLADFGTFGGGASAGRIRVNSITNAANDGSPTVQKGLVVTGVCTATSFSGNADTASGLSGNPSINTTGIITATSFVGSGTNGIKLPVGTTAQRVNTTGTIRFNSTLELPEYYNGSAWIAIDSPPIVSSISPTEVESAAGGNITFTINGERFSVGATVKLISNTGVELTPSPVTRVSATQLTAVIARNSFVNAQEPYDVRVVNASGLSSTLADQINVDNAPTWNTSAGTIATINDTATGTHATISATDADGDTVVYSIVSGSIPAGTSLNSSTGAISGDPTNVSSSTTSSFTARATAGGKTADRSFAIVVNPVNDGTTSARGATSAKAIYDAGYTTSGKSIKYINFGGSVGTKQVWCDFDTQDASGNSGWMLCAKFTEAGQWNGRDVDIRTSNAYIDPGDGYAISCNMADANMNMMRITVEDSANQALGSSADADWYYEWTTTLPWKAVWQPAAGTGSGMTLANGDLIYCSSSGGSGPRRTSIRKFQKSHNIKHNYTNTSHKFNNISDFANNAGDTYTAAGSGVYGGDYHTKSIGSGSEAPNTGTFDMWYALSTNNQPFRIHYIGRTGNYLNRTNPDTDGTIGMLANGSTKTHTGQDQDNECNVKIGYDDDHLWQHIDTNPNNTGGTYANRNSNASGKNMYWWIK